MKYFSLQGLVISTFHSVLGQKMTLCEHTQRILVFPKQKESSNCLGTEFWNYLLEVICKKSCKSRRGSWTCIYTHPKKEFEPWKGREASKSDLLWDKVRTKDLYRMILTRPQSTSSAFQLHTAEEEETEAFLSSSYIHTSISF